MRINRTKPLNINPLKGSNLEPNRNCISQSLTLRDKLLAIKHAQQELGIKSLAANKLDLPFPWQRSSKAQWMGTSPVYWSDFLELEEYLEMERHNFTSSGNVVLDMTWAMSEIVKKLSSDQIENLDFSNSNLMKVAINDPPHDWLSISQGSKSARVNAAITLRIILEKIGHRIWNGADIIRKLLGSETREIRLQGSYAASVTYKHPWRKYINSTGLIEALRKERDSDVRENIARAIIYANPKVILEGRYVDGYGLFTPAEFIELDDDYEIKIALSHGLGNLLVAPQKRGKYYEDFSEIPSLTPQNKIDAFQYSLPILENLINQDNLSENESKLLLNIAFVIELLVSDESIEAFCKECSQAENSTFAQSLGRLAEIDPERFIRVITHAKVRDPSWSHLSAWRNSSEVLSRMLFDRANFEIEKIPLKSYFSLKGNIRKIKDIVWDSTIISNLESALSVIDNSIGNYLARTELKEIIWGDKTDFNFIFSNLLELASASQTSYQLQVLCTLGNLCQEEIKLQDQGQISFTNALTNANDLGFRNTVRKLTYSSPVSPKLLFEPSTENSQGIALLIHRIYTESFKDYFGLSELKERALIVASKVISEKRFLPGLLLSGIAGTGKSLFGKVLANELALPFHILKRDQVNDGRISDGTTIYTIEDYFEKIKKSSPCVLLIDEIQDIVSPTPGSSSERFIKGLNDLKSSNTPIILIGTTNYPSTEEVKGMQINEDGTSSEINKVLEKFVHPECFTVMTPCYFFYNKSVGQNFAREYLIHLSGAGIVNNGNEASSETKTAEKKIEAISRIARGLSPADIITTLSKSTDSFKTSVTLDTISDEIKKLKQNSREILELETMIRSKVESLAFEQVKQKVGEIDYKELALTAEDIPVTEIARILNNAPYELTQACLSALLSEHSAHQL